MATLRNELNLNLFLFPYFQTRKTGKSSKKRSKSVPACILHPRFSKFHSLFSPFGNLSPVSRKFIVSPREIRGKGGITGAGCMRTINFCSKLAQCTWAPKVTKFRLWNYLNFGNFFLYLHFFGARFITSPAKNKRDNPYQISRWSDSQPRRKLNFDSARFWFVGNRSSDNRWPPKC